MGLDDAHQQQPTPELIGLDLNERVGRTIEKPTARLSQRSVFGPVVSRSGEGLGVLRLDGEEPLLDATC